MFSINLFLLFLVSYLAQIYVKGQECPRTNSNPSKNCVSKCFPQIGCASRRRTCICDGDCGFSCVKKVLKCPTPKRPANGQRNVGGRHFNDTVTFSCNLGFTLTGSSLRRCRGSGNWDGVHPICGKPCDDPGQGENTLRKEPLSSNRFQTGVALHYSCINGYHMTRKSGVITCQRDGSWDTSAPQCKRTVCPPPKLPQYSYVRSPSWFNTSGGAGNGRRLYLACSPGYKKVGGSFLICSRDRWQLPTSIKCVPVSCGNPGSPVNGRKSTLNYNFNSRVYYFCNECYKLDGDQYRTCNADGTWSDELPVCKEVDSRCKEISNFKNGKVQITSTRCGGKATFSCYDGYKIIGRPSIRCNESGMWSETFPRCRLILCPSLNTTDSVVANASVYHSGTSIKFACISPNHTLRGKEVISCNSNGVWSHEVPKCLAPCRIKLSKAMISQEFYKHGTKATLSCRDGYQLSGVLEGEMPFCNNGTWQLNTRNFPYCEDEKVVERKKLSFWKNIKSLVSKSN